MHDLPAEWLEPPEEELSPHGKPLPPSTWTPEKEAEVAKWRDDLMAAGEARDLERDTYFGRFIDEHKAKGWTRYRMSIHLDLSVHDISEIEDRNRLRRANG